MQKEKSIANVLERVIFTNNVYRLINLIGSGTDIVQAILVLRSAKKYLRQQILIRLSSFIFEFFSVSELL